MAMPCVSMWDVSACTCDIAEFWAWEALVEGFPWYKYVVTRVKHCMLVLVTLCVCSGGSLVNVFNAGEGRWWWVCAWLSWGVTAHVDT